MSVQSPYTPFFLSGRAQASWLMECLAPKLSSVIRVNGRLLTFQGGGVAFFLFLLIPCDCFFESFVEMGFGLVAELFAGARDVCQGVLDVALAFGAVDGLGGEA